MLSVCLPVYSKGLTVRFPQKYFWFRYMATGNRFIDIVTPQYVETWHGLYGVGLTGGRLTPLPRKAKFFIF